MSERVSEPAPGRCCLEVEALQLRRVSERAGERRGAFGADPVVEEGEALQPRRVSERAGEGRGASGPMRLLKAEALQLRRVIAPASAAPSSPMPSERSMLCNCDAHGASASAAAPSGPM